MNSNTAQAFAACEKTAREHYENFPVASRFVGRELRPYVWTVYAFARTADDFADELADPAESLRRLADWDARLDAATAGEPTDHPIFIAVKKTLDDCDIPPSLLHDLVAAFRMDVTKKRHASFEELDFYCRHSANPVGRLVLLIHGYRDERLMRWSDAICTALQLANFWQDVSVDLKKGRVYLPLDLLARHGYAEAELFNGIFDDRFIAVMKEAVARARRLFHEGEPLIGALGRDLKFEIKLTWNGGMRILDKIERSGYRVLRERPKLGLADKLAILGKAALYAGAHRR